MENDKFWNYILIFLLAILIALQFYWVFFKIPIKNRIPKAILNLALWLSIVILIFPPSWQIKESNKHIGIVSENLPQFFLEKIKDRLKIDALVSKKEFAQTEKAIQNSTKKITLIGNDFSQEFLSNLIGKNLSYEPYQEPNFPIDLDWKAILRQNENQEILGKIELKKDQILKVKFGNTTLDSIKLQKGKSKFKLSFPSFSVGQTTVELFLNESLIQKINYYSRKPKPRKIVMLLENPDFESKTLADWLAKNGNTVEVITELTKNTIQKIDLNKDLTSEDFDILISSPKYAVSAIAKEAIAKNKSLLFINFSDPNSQIQKINKTLGTVFTTKRISNESEIKLINEISAFPYQFEKNISQKQLLQLPIIVNHNHIGISLLNETYPLALSGDSLNYRKIWGGILRMLIPIEKENLTLNAPVFIDQKIDFYINNFENPINKIAISGDTISLSNAPLNMYSKNGSYIFRKNGWQPFLDSLAIYVEEKPIPFQNINQILDFVKQNKITFQTINQNMMYRLPTWFIFGLIISILALLWIEPKINT